MRQNLEPARADVAAKSSHARVFYNLNDGSPDFGTQQAGSGSGVT